MTKISNGISRNYFAIKKQIVKTTIQILTKVITHLEEETPSERNNGYFLNCIIIHLIKEHVGKRCKFLGSTDNTAKTHDITPPCMSDLNSYYSCMKTI